MNDNNRKLTTQDTEHKANVFNSSDSSAAAFDGAAKSMVFCCYTFNTSKLLVETYADFLIQNNIESFFHVTLSIHLSAIAN